MSDNSRLFGRLVETDHDYRQALRYNRSNEAVEEHPRKSVCRLLTFGLILHGLCRALTTIEGEP